MNRLSHGTAAQVQPDFRVTASMAFAEGLAAANTCVAFVFLEDNEL